MSSDSLSHITVIPLATGKSEAPLCSYELIQKVQEELIQKKQVVLVHNRRGYARSFLCRDCGTVLHCPYCSIHLTFHTDPIKRLLCHQCNYQQPVPLECSQCGGAFLEHFWYGLQRIESEIHRLFPWRHIARIDSDVEMKDLPLSADIILVTNSSVWIFWLNNVSLIWFLQFESDLMLSDYAMTEKLFATFQYAKLSQKSIIIQTLLSTHPLLDQIVSGNYRDFLDGLLRDRSSFQYPPYTDIARIIVTDHSRERVQDIMTKIVNKMSQMTEFEEIIRDVDQELWTRVGDEWRQKITLRGKDLDQVMSLLRSEILKNRGVALEWI